MPKQFEISEAKEHLDEVLSRARAGEEIILAESGRPVVRVTSAETGNGHRVFGEFAGRIQMSDDFASPLSLQ